MQKWNDSFKDKLNSKSLLRQWAKSVDLSDQTFQPSFLLDFLKSYSQPGQIWGVFNSIQNEPKVDYISAKDLGLTLAYPKVTDQGLIFYKSKSSEQIENPQFKNNDFRSSALGVLEPITGEVISKEQISGLIIPGLAFDHRGLRLGRGKSYYDKYLKEYSGLKVGLTWSHFFIPASIPKDEWDMAMDFIVTEKFLYQPMISWTSSAVLEIDNESRASG